jgi:uncharacterized protein YndB with AHSA1/START domain
MIDGKIVDGNTVRFERMLPGPIERVWDFLTRPEHLATWLAPGDFEQRIGGFIELRTIGGIVRGIVTRSDPPRELAYSWLHLSSAHLVDDDSLLRFQLEPRGDQVLLVLTHRRITPEYFSKVLAGWHLMLDALAISLRGGRPSPFMEQFARIESEYLA